MAHIAKRATKKGTRYDVRYPAPSGGYRTKTFRTRKDADRFQTEIEAAKYRGAWVDPRLGQLTFAEWVEQYLASSHHKRATTLARDRRVLAAHFLPAFGSRQLASITPLDVRNAIDDMRARLAPATLRTDYGVLCGVFNAAVDAELLVRSPCRGVKLPAARRQREIKFLTPAELRRLADAMPAEYRMLVYLAGVLGLRWSECVGLRVAAC